MRKKTFLFLGLLLAFPAARRARAVDPTPPDLRVGVAGHAFDHLGNIAAQADAATAAGFNVLYTTGVGSLGYTGLPAPADLDAAVKTSLAYNTRAKQSGARLAIGYVCATSIVHLDTFDKNWPPTFRAQFSTPPADWLQQDQAGHPLPSWYGGDYRPACMNNPDWRTYEKSILRLQLLSGHDGIFFDNPTVHPRGCYCPHCMKRFATYLREHGTDIPPTATTDDLRHLAATHPEAFLRFRSTIARDFIADMRTYARTINPRAYVTCNNSLNAPEAFYSQSRTYGYDIDELSKSEDWITVEDMATQPRTLASGATVEYAPVYALLHAISHDKPIVAVTIADGDYHTPPNLVRLAMAEAAAHAASYLAWPTWPEPVRPRLITSIRPESDFLRQQADLLNDTTPRADAVLYLPFQRWTTTDNCQPLTIARSLTAANIPFRAISESDFAATLTDPTRPLLIESPDVLTPAQKQQLDHHTTAGGHVIWTSAKDWLNDLRSHIPTPSLTLTAPPTCRVTIHDQPTRTIVHLLNLNVQRLSSYDDKVIPATHLHLTIRTPLTNIKSVTALTADETATHGPLPFTLTPSPTGPLVTIDLPTLTLSTILVIE